MLEHIYWISVIWLVSFVIGLVSMPVSRLVFKSFSDKGYAFSKLLGWLAISYIAFLSITLKAFSLSITPLLFAAFVWLAFNGFLFLKRRDKILPSWRKIIVTEVIFLLAFCGIVLVKSFQPEIYQIERFMDYGFIQALRNGGSLPLQDIWFAGQHVNYYYFSHFIGFSVLTLTGIDTLPGFYLLTALIFAFMATAVWRFGFETASFLVGRQVRKLLAWSGGLLSVFSVLLAGTWYMVPWLVKKILSRPVSFFYPEPTRAIPGTITEMPIYSFIVAELHAHLWGLLSGILVLAILYSWWRDDASKLGFKNRYLWFLAFVLGLSFMINSWDALTLGVLSVAVLALKYWRSGKVRLLVFAPLLGVLAYIFALPWSFFNKAPIEGVGLIFFPSPFWDWLSFWGSVVIIPVIYTFLALKKHHRDVLFPAIVIYAGLFFLALIELVYVKDILSKGEWYRANTVFKLTLQIWLWINVFSGPLFVWLYLSLKKRLTRVFVILLLLVYVSLGLIYPVIALRQSSFEGRELTGIDKGLDWWLKKYPDDYRAYLFLDDLKKKLPDGQRMRTIVEAEGESYTDVSRFSVFLGWPTIVGWPVHEWTWRGSYDEVAKRREEVRQVYIGSDPEAAGSILDTYGVNYIIVGQIERWRYGADLKVEKLRALGNVVFENKGTFIVEYLGRICFEKHCFNVENAVTPQDQAKGLMFRQELEKDRGMLFIFEEPGIYSFWMKNTLIPLDIIWLDEDKEVVSLSKNTQPCKADPCPSFSPGKTAKYVLELNSGLADEIGLTIGDKLVF